MEELNGRIIAVLKDDGVHIDCKMDVKGIYDTCLTLLNSIRPVLIPTDVKNEISKRKLELIDELLKLEYEKN